MTQSGGIISSPAATGAAGTQFEQHLGAFWLAQLLTGAIPPVIRDCVVRSVSFQTKRFGWRTDDFLIEGENGAGVSRKLVVQAKRSFTVSASDPECTKTFKDFWDDYRDPGRFDPVNDRFVLATMRGTDSLLRSLGGLLECARAASDSGDFLARLTVPGVVEAKAKSYLEVITAIVSDTGGGTPSHEELWSFLRVVYILGVDLTTDTGQVEALVKSLLAQTANVADKMGAADETWNALVRMAGEAMPASKTLRREDLSDAVCIRHAPIGAAEHAVLKALSDHTEPILSRVRGLIGGRLRLGRKLVVGQALDALQTNQVVLISGPAGGGKSCVAKAVAETLSKGYFVFCFRGEEFGESHLDGTLAKAQVQASAKRLGAILAGQTRKVLLVESVERLLEKPSRDAFADLLEMISKDDGWLLVLTCRDYSTELVRDSLLAASGLRHRVITVPPLNDDELAEIVAGFQMLIRPLGDGRLRNLFRNPYVLDKAVGIDWSDEGPLPQSERAFRDRFWRDIVRNGNPTGDMPRRRDTCFVEVARRRADALTPYADCSGLDREALRSLQSDSLVVAEDDDHFATAHDVLEDWAILRWIGSQYQTCEGSAHALSARLGESPAVRRTFRKWASELVVEDPAAADRLFRAAAAGEGHSERFNDDCLVALLQSDASPAFLVAHKDLMVADGHKLLNKLIYLLRVACFATPEGESAVDSVGTRYVPVGPAWASILAVVNESLPSFVESDRGLLLGLIEDWAKGVSVEIPYPAGSTEAASIALWSLARMDGWVPPEVSGRALRVLSKIPKGDTDSFTAMLTGSPKHWTNEYTDDLRKIVLEGAEGVYAARDLPEVVCAAATDYLLEAQAERDEEYHYAADFGVEASFGIHLGRQHAFFPPSAYCGPLLFLLRFHHLHGIRLLQAIFNYSAERYAHQDGPQRKIEPPEAVTITFSNGTSRQQWFSGQLWGLYRGVTDGPCCLQSMLMALERWLREVAECSPELLDTILQVILLGTNNASVTAVIASISVAYPSRCSETLLALLGVREYVQIDLSRSVAERTSSLGEMGFATVPLGGVYAAERREANGWPHRQGHIETAIFEVQSGSFAERIQSVIDRHRAALPPSGERSEDDLIWSLALDRMDRRQLTISTPEREIVLADGTRYIQMETQVSDPVAKAMANESAVRHAGLNGRLALLVWADRSFRREPVDGPADSWCEQLATARSLPKDEDPDNLAADGPALVAAVCVRDHWENMDAGNRAWCARTVCAAVSETANTWDHISRMQRHAMSGGRACAEVLPALLGQCGEGDVRAQVSDALLVAVTHPVDEVRNGAFHGITVAGLLKVDRMTAKMCLNAAAIEAVELAKAWKIERETSYDQGRQHKDISADVALSVLARLRARDPELMGEAFLGMASKMWVRDKAAVRILSVLNSVPDDPSATQAYVLAAGALTARWAAGRETRPHYEVEYAVADQIANFALRAPEQATGQILRPIVEAVGRCPEETGRFVQSLICAEDRHRQGAKFWKVWEMFATAAVSAPWIRTLHWEHPTGRKLVSSLFLMETHWNDGARHWRCLDGFSDRIDALYDRLPAVPLPSELYLLFLLRVGERSLPNGFQRVAVRLQAGDAALTLANDDARYALETILRRFVYGKPLELKSHAVLRESVRYLLDRLVDVGSSTAFKMRDDFSTPIPPAISG